MAYANVREVMNSELPRALPQVRARHQERDEFQQKTGVNIEEDIDTVVAAMMPGAAVDAARSPTRAC